MSKQTSLLPCDIVHRWLIWVISIDVHNVQATIIIARLVYWLIDNINFSVLKLQAVFYILVRLSSETFVAET